MDTDPILIEKATQWAERKGFAKIKSQIDGYEDPKSFTQSSADKSMSPHVSGLSGASKHYVEVATKTDNVTQLVSKWKLLSHLAGRTGGKLHLLAPRGHKRFVENLCDKYLLNAKLVYQEKW